MKSHLVSFFSVMVWYTDLHHSNFSCERYMSGKMKLVLKIIKIKALAKKIKSVISNVLYINKLTLIFNFFLNIFVCSNGIFYTMHLFRFAICKCCCFLATFNLANGFISVICLWSNELWGKWWDKICW